MKHLKIGDVIYWARVYPFVGKCEVLQLTVRTIYERCFVGVDSGHTGQAFIISMNELEETVFDNPYYAEQIVMREKENMREFTTDKNDE